MPNLYRDDTRDVPQFDQLFIFIKESSKVLVIGGLFFFAVLIINGSAFRAITIALICMVLSSYARWRRYLEPLSFLFFIAAAVYWCRPDVFISAKAAFCSIN